MHIHLQVRGGGYGQVWDCGLGGGCAQVHACFFGLRCKGRDYWWLCAVGSPAPTNTQGSSPTARAPGATQQSITATASGCKRGSHTFCPWTPCLPSAPDFSPCLSGHWGLVLLCLHSDPSAPVSSLRPQCSCVFTPTPQCLALIQPCMDGAPHHRPLAKPCTLNYSAQPLPACKPAVCEPCQHPDLQCTAPGSALTQYAWLLPVRKPAVCGPRQHPDLQRTASASVRFHVDRPSRSLPCFIPQ